MTRERAIDLCRAIDQYLCAGNPIWDTGQIHEAMKMATEALSDVPDTNVGDMISRQAAMDLPVLPKEYRQYQTYNLDDAYELGWNDCQMHLNSLPSAEPETAKRIVGCARSGMTMWYQCDMCHEPVDEKDVFCRGCGRRFEDEDNV